MKKNIYILLLLLIIIYSSYNITSSFSSNNTLIFDGNTNSFTYYNLDSDDLFNEFKDLVPGDIKTQTINIKGVNIKNNSKLYLELNTDINEEVLKYINVTVYKDDIELNKYNDTIIIANFKENDSFTIKIKVEVPIEVDNAIEDLETSLRWTFLIEENDKLTEVPFTYDSSNIIVNILTLILSLIAIILLILNTKKNNKVG